MEHRVDALPRAKCGELRDRCRLITDTGHWRVSSSLQNGALTRLRERPVMIQGPGPHCLGGLNANIRQAQNPCSQKVTNKLMEFGLVDLLCHF